MIICKSPFVAKREQEERIYINIYIYIYIYSFSCLILLVDVNDLTVLEFEKTTRRIQEKNIKAKHPFTCSVRSNGGRVWEKKEIQWKRKNWYNSSRYNILIKKIQLLMYSSPSDLMNYCSWAKKKICDLENPLETIFLISLSIIEIILLLSKLLEML